VGSHELVVPRGGTLQEDEPDRFDAIVSEAKVAQPDLSGRDPLSLVTLYLYDQRVNTA
jgi:hypothetical protein